MHRGIRFTPRHGIMLAGLIAGAIVFSPRVAASQARGTLQVSATVVQPVQTTLAGLTAASSATKDWAVTGKQPTNDVSTVAQVQVLRSAQAPADLIVQIDYLKN